MSQEDILFNRVWTKINSTSRPLLINIHGQAMEVVAQLDPYNYLYFRKGKKLRLVLSILINELFTSQINLKVLKVGQLIEMIHCSSLIIDDIQDNSIQRRGKPCSHLKYGIASSINASNIMYFLSAKQLLSQIQHPTQRLELWNIFIDQMTQCHIGQAEDIQVHCSQTAQELPSLTAYIGMISGKTGSLLRMLAKMVGVLIECTPHTRNILAKIMNWVGIAFQITDDVLNVTQDMGKGIVAEDFYQKKFTAIIHYMKFNNRFIQLFLKKKKQRQQVDEMLSLMKKTTTIQKCYRLAKGYRQKAIVNIQNLPFCSQNARDNFKTIINFIVNRTK